MTQEERDIYNFLKGAPEIYFSVREIARRAGRRDMRHEPSAWISEFLQRLVRKGVVEADNSGHYRLKPRPEVQAAGRKWISPHIARLLKDSSKDYSDVVVTEINEADFDEANL